MNEKKMNTADQTIFDREYKDILTEKDKALYRAFDSLKKLQGDNGCNDKHR